MKPKLEKPFLTLMHPRTHRPKTLDVGLKDNAQALLGSRVTSSSSAPPLLLSPLPDPACTAPTFYFRATPTLRRLPMTAGAEHCGPAGQRDREEGGRKEKAKDQCEPAGPVPARAHG